ncbi:MAG: restriction endonuclease subunit S, partial [Micavibrio sp.]
TSKNLKTGIISFADVSFISEKDFIEINKRSKVEKGDILMPMIGTIGNPVLVEFEPNFAIKNVALFREENSSIDMVYLLYLLRSHFFDYVTSKSNRGGTQKFISLGDLRNLQIPIPKSDEIKVFKETVKGLKQKIAHNTEHLYLCNNLFSSLTQRAFRGELTAQKEAA